MIILDIQPYCHACMDFDPSVEKPIRMFNDNVKVIQSDTIVRCSHRKCCENIRRYLERQAKGEQNG